MKNPREAAAYTFGYNPALFVHRVHDVLSALQLVKAHERLSKRVTLVGFDGAGPWVAAARAQAGLAVDAAAIDTGGFRFGQVLDIHDPNFLPGGAKYGDVPALLALGAAGDLWVASESAAALALAQRQYPAEIASQKITRSEATGPVARAEAVKWLLNLPVQ